MRHRWERIGDLFFLFLLVGVDQLTKYLAETHLSGGRDIPLIKDFFRLHYLEGGNTGGAFGLFQGGFPFFCISITLMLAVILLIYCRLPMNQKYRPLRLTLVLLSAGALGNFIDRIYTLFTTGTSYVIDFLYWEWIDFPVFNVADCYVTLSCIILAIIIFFQFKDEDFDVIIHSRKFMEKKKLEGKNLSEKNDSL